MRRKLISVGLSLVAVTVLCGAAPEIKPAGSPEPWLRWVIPLPKEVSIEQQIILPAADVRITLRDGADELERNAARKLRSLFIEKGGAEAETGSSFEIFLGVCDGQGRLGEMTVPDAARLSELPNREQAYLIRPLGDDRLVLAALDARGVFYAALTLRQLLEPKFGRDSVTLPLASITDWPDMAERGEWGGSVLRDIEWLAERKMNLVEFHGGHSVDAQGAPVTSISRSLLQRGRMNAVMMVPKIQHLNRLAARGVYKAYPDVRGKGERAEYRDGQTTLVAPCASNPKLPEIIAGWLRGYAKHGARDVACDLGELGQQRCECKACAEAGQFVLETRAFVEAWRLARKDFPDLRISILLTQGSYGSNDKVLAEIPPEVGATYYDGGKTYDSSRDPMI
ncbi:MAG: hypothetical protein HQ559_17385, partial [Lentisphaerae bacterium]|nr:hypothetical protein [Lentisphaerota bacterium]